MYATLLALGAIFIGIACVALFAMPLYVVCALALCGMAFGLLADDMFAQGSSEPAQ
jgi:hypothetical protein